jgi:hypothetical protein
MAIFFDNVVPVLNADVSATTRAIGVSRSAARLVLPSWESIEQTQRIAVFLLYPYLTDQHD